VSDNFGLAIALAGPWQEAHPELVDEIESAATAGLYKAARRYQWTRGVKFSHYARRRILGSIKDAIIAAAPRGYRQSAARAAQAPRIYPAGDDAAGAFVDRRPGPETAEEAEAERVASNERFELRIAELADPRERVYLRLVYGESVEPAEAAAVLGMRPGEADALHAQALARLRGPDVAGVAPRVPIGPMVSPM
jgi:RNA polymerase sigma factor (sigma-70 family)